jgi:hypothetical protein
VQDERYATIVRSKYFSTNWNDNLQSSLHSKEKRARGRRIVRQLLESGRPVLNAGSNIGYHSILSSKAGHSVVSLDPSIEALKYGSSLGWISDPVCGDVMNLPFRDGSFSSAIFSEVIEEIPDQVSAVSELSRCSQRLIITTSPIKSDVFYNLSKRVKSMLGKNPMEFAHLNEMHPDVILSILKSKNLRISQVSFSNPFHAWNIMALIPFLNRLDLSPLDSLLGFKYISGSVLCVADK